MLCCLITSSVLINVYIFLSCFQNELTNIQWQDVQKRLIEVQQVHQMCVHKEELTELGKYIVNPAVTCTVYGPEFRAGAVSVLCAQSLKTTLFRLLGAQGTIIVFSPPLI